MAHFYALCKVGTTNPRILSRLNIRFDAFPNWNCIISPSALLLTSGSHFRQHVNTKIIYKIMQSLNQLMILYASSLVLSDTSLNAGTWPTLARTKAAGYTGYHANSNVSRILPVTTLRTIDLGVIIYLAHVAVSATMPSMAVGVIVSLFACVKYIFTKFRSFVF
jgi:hypothetical protein